MKSCDCGRDLAGCCACADRSTSEGDGPRYRHLIVQPPEEPPPVTFEGVDNGVTYRVDVRSVDVLWIRDADREKGTGVWLRTAVLEELLAHFGRRNRVRLSDPDLALRAAARDLIKLYDDSGLQCEAKERMRRALRAAEGGTDADHG